MDVENRSLAQARGEPAPKILKTGGVWTSMLRTLEKANGMPQNRFQTTGFANFLHAAEFAVNPFNNPPALRSYTLPVGRSPPATRALFWSFRAQCVASSDAFLRVYRARSTTAGG